MKIRHRRNRWPEIGPKNERKEGPERAKGRGFDQLRSKLDRNRGPSVKV